MKSLELKVQLPMILYMDNKGGVDIFNNWSIAGHTRAISVRLAYIRELKEAGILQIKWISGPAFRKHGERFESTGYE